MWSKFDWIDLDWQSVSWDVPFGSLDNGPPPACCGNWALFLPISPWHQQRSHTLDEEYSGALRGVKLRTFSWSSSFSLAFCFTKCLMSWFLWTQSSVSSSLQDVWDLVGSPSIFWKIDLHSVLEYAGTVKAAILLVSPRNYSLVLPVVSCSNIILS